MWLWKLELQKSMHKKQPQVAANKDSTKLATANKTFVVTLFQRMWDEFSAVTASSYVSSHIRLYIKFLLRPRAEPKLKIKRVFFYHIPCGGCIKVYL